jgi:hypothetical protein
LGRCVALGVEEAVSKEARGEEAVDDVVEEGQEDLFLAAAGQSWRMFVLSSSKQRRSICP